ncbi:MAG TPA: ABC transporter ATP-binding protein [Thermoprotei archaeon]|nr:ABC transporter ATP-binding protein [Thermoprotei archaeon]
MKSLVELKNIWFRYEGQEDYILKDINLEIRDRDILLLLGRSGSGKTTIARIITGLIPHFYRGELKGNVIINGRSIVNKPIYEIAEYVGLIRQNPENQILMTNVEREIAFSLEFLDIPREDMRKRVHETANKLGISNLLSRDIDSLSGGELQKVAIASILVRKPSIIILDEPSSYLSPSSVNRLRQYIMMLNSEGIAFLIIDHRIDYWLDITTRIAVIYKGKKIFDNNLTEFLKFIEKFDVGLNIPLHLRLAIDVNKCCGKRVLPITQDTKKVLQILQKGGNNDRV